MNEIQEQPAIATRRGEKDRSARREARYPPIGDFETIEIDGARPRLHLLDIGPRAPEAILLIHGASGNLRDFAFSFIAALQADPAAAGRRIIAIDRPGFGYSDRGPRAAWRPELQARMMRQALARRGVERVVLLGHSLGAASALAWALDAPTTVRGLVVVSGVSHTWPGSAGLTYDLLSSPLIGAGVARIGAALVSEARAKRVLETVFAPQTPPPGYADYIGLALALRPATLRANGRDVARLKPILKEQAARYRTIDAPVAIVHGGADRVVPAEIHAEPLARAIRSSELTILKTVGHMPHHAVDKTVIEAASRVFARSTA